MFNRIKKAAVFAGLIMATTPASAEDWTAVYGGVGAGAGAIVNELNLAIPPLAGANLNFNGVGGEGGFFTLQLGADVQVAPSFVIGAFIDYDFSGIGSDITLSVPGAPLTIAGELDVDSQLSIGARVGVLPTASKQTLWYAQAGYTRVEFDDATLTGTGLINFSLSASLPDFSGYFVGGGVETMLTDNVSLKADYRFTQLSSESLITIPGILDFTAEPSLHTARIVATYRFPLRDTGVADTFK